MKDMKGMKGRGPGFWERIDHGWHGWERILLRQGFLRRPVGYGGQVVGQVGA